MANNLSKWDYAYEFLLYEAAALVVGIDPIDVYYSTGPAKDNPEILDFHEHPEIKPVVDRMRRDYFSAVELYEAKLTGRWKYPERQPLQDTIFRRREMEGIPLQIGKMEEPPDSDMLAALRYWKVEEDLIYETAKFTRLEIARWLSANDMKSVYQFGGAATEMTPRSSPATVDAPFPRWPWGKHHTELLGHLEAAAQRFWVNYDPSDATTAPINTAVSEWLHTERKVSRTMASAIATMLRPDGLPTGPRTYLSDPIKNQ